MVPKTNNETVTDSKGRLRAAAVELFWKRGFAATTTRELADAAGITKATMYYHVRRKEDLLVEICMQSLEAMNAAANEIRSSSADPLDRLRRLIVRHVTTALADQGAHTVMLTELRMLDEPERATVLQRRREYEDIVQETIAEARDSGVIRNDIPVSILRLALLNMLNWTIFWFRDDGAVSPGELGGMYADMFLDGVRPRISAPHPPEISVP